MTESGDSDGNASKGSSTIRVNAVCFYYFAGAQRAKLTFCIYGMHL